MTTTSTRPRPAVTERRRPRFVKPRKPRRIFTTILAFVMLVFLLAPTAMVFPLALSAGRVLRFPPDELSLVHIENVATSGVWQKALITSVQVGLGAALIATIIGTLAASVMPRRRVLSLPLQLAIALPLVLPPVVLAVAWFGLFSDLSLIGSKLGIIIGHGFMGVPFVFLNVSGALSNLNPEYLLAARSLGARAHTVFLRIVLPIIGPGVVAGAVLTFVISFDELILPLFLGAGVVPTIPQVLWSQIQHTTTPEIAAVAAITTAFTLSVLAGYLILARSFGATKKVK